MKLWSTPSAAKEPAPAPRFPGARSALDGSSAVVAVESLASEAASAHPAIPCSAMVGGWDRAASEGRTNAFGRPLISVSPENAAAGFAVTSGMSMAGLRATTFTDGPGLVSMHESLHVAAGQRRPCVVHVAASALASQARSVHAGHEAYHAVADAGAFQVFAKNVQEAADLGLVARRIAEFSLTPGIVAQDAGATAHTIEPLALPERALVETYLGAPDDRIDAPTEAQRLVFGDTRLRVPVAFDVDYPAMQGPTQGALSFAQGRAAQRPYWLEPIAGIADAAFDAFAALTGRRYARASGYRLDDASWVIVAQGSVVGTAEAVVDHLRDTRGLKVGVLNLTMLRPFPSDLVGSWLARRKGVLVLERTDQPLAADAPLLSEIRAALSKGLENGRDSVPRGGLAVLHQGDVPEFYSGCFGLGGHDLQPGDVVAAIENMLPGGAGRRQFYLGLDFQRPGTRLPKLQIWQETLVDRYPGIRNLALPRAQAGTGLPGTSVAVRIHALNGQDVANLGRELTRLAFDTLKLEVRTRLPFASGKTGQPVSGSLVIAREPIRSNAAAHTVDVVLCPDPSVFRHTDPLMGLVENGLVVAQSSQTPEDFWKSLPAAARHAIVERKVRLNILDAATIARDGTLRSAAFVGAFLGLSPVLEREGQTPATVLAELEKRSERDIAFASPTAWLSAVRRGLDETKRVPTDAAVPDAPFGPTRPLLTPPQNAAPGPAHEGRFWEQVGSVSRLGEDGIADPFAALGVIPAATAAARDMSASRLEIPEFNGLKCTGCGDCFTQCPDAAIPGLVSSAEDVLNATLQDAATTTPLERLRPLVRNWAKETHRLLQKDAGGAPGLAFALAYDAVASKMGWDAERRAATDAEFHVVQARLAELPLARTRFFFDDPEAKARGTGGLLSITVNPDACTGCKVCVTACKEGALRMVAQDTPALERLRRNRSVWHRLPDTDARYIDVDAGGDRPGALSSLLLRKATYRSMVGGDGACAGCGEKTATHLILSAIHAHMAPRVAAHVAKLDSLITALDEQARALIASGVDLKAAAAAKGAVMVPVDEERHRHLEACQRSADALRDLLWRHVEGPGGHGRAALGMANSAGCSATWASAYPYNPYPFPWVSHTAFDSPSVALGLFEAQMRRMAEGFAAVRRAVRVLDDTYDAAGDEPALRALHWKDFTDEEFLLCPPIVAMGGDGALMDGGLQSLSRLFDSGKPVRVIVLDTQGHSDSGGQSTSADFRAGGSRAGGLRKEPSLLAIAHRGVFVHQSSQASPAHLMGGVLRGLQQRRPALFNVYAPCGLRHGFADGAASEAAHLALESRAFPFLTYDPERGPTLSDRLSLEGNPPEPSERSTRTLRYLDEAGVEQTLRVPLTLADWAFTEDRFRSHFSELPADGSVEAQPFDQVVALAEPERSETAAFIHAVGPDRRLRRLRVSPELVALAVERAEFWSLLRQMAGAEIADGTRRKVWAALESETDARLEALRADYEARIETLKREYPPRIARRLAEALMRHGGGGALAELLATLAPASPAPVPEAPVAKASPAAPEPRKAEPAPAAPPPATPTGPAAEAAPAAPVADDGPMTLEAYIDSARCTSCNECINLNRKMFAYNAAKQAEIKDASAGTFQQLVLAAERCPVSIIHPGSPLDPNEKDLEKWRKRAEKFN